MHHHEAKWKPKDSQLFPACPLWLWTDRKSKRYLMLCM
jgi:hypothetical protein